jgi:hypothetical protein
MKEFFFDNFIKNLKINVFLPQFDKSLEIWYLITYLQVFKNIICSIFLVNINSIYINTICQIMFLEVILD